MAAFAKSGWKGPRDDRSTRPLTARLVRHLREGAADDLRRDAREAAMAAFAKVGGGNGRTILNYERRRAS